MKTFKECVKKFIPSFDEKKDQLDFMTAELAAQYYASQFIDEAANKYIPDDNPKIFRDKILKLKQDLK